MNTPRHYRSLLLALGVTAFTVSEVSAVGFRFPHQDPEAVARGNAWVATADTAAAVYANPAGLTQLEGHQLSVGLYLATMGIDFTSATGGSADADSSLQPVPQLFYAWSPQDSRWSFGFGVYAPYGLGIDYGNDTPFPTVAEEAQLLYASFNPVVAFQVTNTLSIGAGLTLNYSDVNFERSIGLVPTGDEFKFEGDGYATGFNIGLRWQPHDQWSFGLNYRSHTEVTYDGQSKAVPLAGWQNTDANIDFPSYIDVGVSYRPNEDWNFEFNLDWTDWDSVNTSTFVGTFAGDVDFPFNYESSFMYEFGVTRYLEDGWFVSAGYIYSENSVPDTTLSPLNPDADLHLGNVGVGRRGEDWSWALAYQFAYGERKVSGNTPNPISGQSANGKFDIFNQGINLMVRRSF